MDRAVSLAHRRLEDAIAPRVHQPGVRTFGTGFSLIAALTTVLGEENRVRFARGMLDFANDREETALNRHEALIALQGIARLLPAHVRDELFEQTVLFAEGRHEAAERGRRGRATS